MISLRAYNREIESLIDNSRYDEAIAHCKHILTTYPKCIETYRLLGKTLLECKRYPEALDIFLRVITAYTDDFISHVGLSIIYEDERDLDLSIWHMEQAFDVQPSNIAIQEELKRLFGRRDGSPPQKIRLSRGALVRMYARGELFQQAIAEIRSTLSEDPKRVDLEVILAKMHYLSGSMVEAADTCNQIIERIPFCFEANKILDEILTKNGNVENATIYRNRLITLDPYYRFHSSSNTQEVPDEKIPVEKLIYTPSLASDSSVPAWTKAIGVEWDEKQSEMNVDWLSGLKNENQTPNSESVSSKTSSSAFLSTAEVTLKSESNSTVETGQQDEIPDWMKNAGWVPSDGSAEEPNSYSLDDTSDNSQLAQNNELPDWLKTIAPDDLLLKKEENVDLPDQDTNMPDNSPTEFNLSFDKTTEVDNLNHPLSDWKQEENMDNDSSEIKNSNDDANSSPDWLSQFSNNEEKKEASSSSQDLPDWLKNFEQDQTTEGSKDNDVPDWLKNLQASQVAASENDAENIHSAEGNEENSISENTAEEPLDMDFPDYLARLKEDEPDDLPQSKTEIVTNLLNTQKNENQAESESVLPPQMPNLPNGWQNDISEPANGSELTEADAANDGIPDWVRSVLGSPVASVENDAELIQPEDKSLEQAQSSETLSSNSEASLSDELNPTETEAGVISQQTNDELLEWLRGLKPEDELPSDETTKTEAPNSNLDEEDSSSIEFDIDRLDELTEEQKIQSEEPQQVESVFEQSAQDIEQVTDFASQAVDGLILTSSDNPEASAVIHPAEEELNSLFSREITDETPTISVNRGSVAEINELNQLEDTLARADSGSESLKSVTNSTEEFNDLIDREDYENIPGVFTQMLASGKDFETLIDSLSSQSANKESNFAYWQCLGDIYASQNKLDDAISAYEKAEELLSNTLNS